MSVLADWFVLAVDWYESDWLIDLPWEVRAVWPVMLGYVKHHGRGGVCKAPRIERFAEIHRIPLDACNALRNAAVTDGALRVTDGDWVISNWSDYQKEDPSNAERQRRHREKKKRSKLQFEPNSTIETGDNNALRNGDNGSNALRNESNATSPHLTSPQNYILSPTGDQAVKQRKSRKPVGKHQEAWEKFKASYPPREGSLDAYKGQGILDRLIDQSEDLDTILDGVNRYRKHCDVTGKTGTAYVKQIPSWLNGKCWLENWEVSHLNGHMPKLGKVLTEAQLAEAMR
jgi:hypothetical protein